MYSTKKCSPVNPKTAGNVTDAYFRAVQLDTQLQIYVLYKIPSHRMGLDAPDVNIMYTRLQTVWSLPGHSRQANKGHSPRCHHRPNSPGRLADKVFQPTTQYAKGCTYIQGV